MAKKSNANKVRYKMYKSGKLWLISGITFATLGATALFTAPVARADSNADQVTQTSSASDSAAVVVASSASVSSIAAVSASSAVSSAVSVAAYDSTKLNAASGAVLSNSTSVSAKINNSEALMTNTILNQNFHYNTPRGYSNDLQTILPHTDGSGNVDYYDVYYLYNPYPSQIQFADEWYHATTTDFKTFQAYDSADPTGLNNVAIPDPDYQDANGKAGGQIAANNTTDGIPWEYAATGSVLYNDGLLKTDQWNNPINANAKLAYFTSFTSTGDQQTFLAYSNDDQQFHPYRSTPVMTRQQFGITVQDFRDPYVERVNNKLVAYVSGGWSKKMYTFTSTDGVNWDYNPANDINLDQGTAMEVETPIVKTVNEQAFMFYSWSNGDAASDKAIAYINGYIDSDGLFKTNSSSKITTLDQSAYKGDTYAGNFTNVDPDTLVNINWSGSWQYSLLSSLYTYTYSKHSGSFTLPRLLQNVNGTLWSTPIEPNNQLVSTIKVAKNASKKSFIIGTNNKLDFTFDNPNSSHTINLKRGESDISIKVGKGRLVLSRKNAINSLLAKQVQIPLTNATTAKMSLYLDNSTLEIYLPESNMLYNVVNFTSNQNDPYKLTSNTGATIDNYEFNANYPALTVGELNATVQHLNGYIATDNDSLQHLQSVMKRYYQTNIKGNDYYFVNSQATTATNQLSAAQSSISVANSYVARANALANDARGSLYLTLASAAYNSASTAETYATQAIMAANNTMAADAPADFKNQTTIKGNRVQFVDQKQVSGKMVTDQAGNTHYYDSLTGYQLTNTFYFKNGKYYYFDQAGNLVKNRFVQAAANTNYYYYFNQKGQALTGHQVIGHKHYLFDGNGIQVRNQFVKSKSGKFYYYDAKGVLVTKSRTVNGHKLTINRNGQILNRNQLLTVRDPITHQLSTYYLDHNGSAYHGIKRVGHFLYDFGKNGKSINGVFVLNAHNQVAGFYDQYGSVIKLEYAKAFDKDEYYFFDKNGKAVSGSYTVNGIDQYFNPKGVLVMNSFLYFKDGRIKFAEAHGNIYKNFLFEEGGKQYYAQADGYLLQDATKVINGVEYSADHSGVLTPVQTGSQSV